jgi:hypothetical protein
MKVPRKVIKSLYDDKGKPKKDHDLPASLRREPAPLSLVPTIMDKDELDKRKKSKFEHKVNPEDEGSPKVCTTILHIDGSEGLREAIKWYKAIQSLIKGLQMTTIDSMVDLVVQCCEGAAQAAFNETLVLVKEEKREAIKKAVASVKASPANTLEERKAAAREAAEAANRITRDDITRCLQAVIAHAAPFKVLTKQQRHMKKWMRKPADMKIRTYMSHIFNINNEELPYLPPFAGDSQKLDKDDIVEVILNACPNSWTNEMTRQNFDTDCHTLKEIIEFCERLEAAEPARTPASKADSHEQSRKKSKANGKSSDGGKWCVLHESDTHDTADCRTILAQKKKFKSDKPNNKNKSWKRKADDEKSYTKAEVNALIKKAVESERKGWEKRSPGKRKAAEANMTEENETVTTSKSDTSSPDVDDLDLQFLEMELDQKKDEYKETEPSAVDDDDEFEFE